MPTRESARQRGARRSRSLLLRVGSELRTARVGAGLSTRTVGAVAGVSHTQVRRIEIGGAPHVDLIVIARLAATLGHELSLGVHPVAAPVRDAGHVALLARFRARLHPSVEWRAEVPLPIPGDARSADATLRIGKITALVEAETRLGDIQAVERRIRMKQRDLGADRVVLVVAASRHDRAVIAAVPELRLEFPVAARTCLARLGRGIDPGGDCLLVL